MGQTGGVLASMLVAVLGSSLAASTAMADSRAWEARLPLARDESIYVLQRRAYAKASKLEITPFFYTGLNPKFVGYLGVGLSAAYHLRENLALEVVTSVPYLSSAFYSDLVYEVYRYSDRLTPQDVDLKQMTYFGGISLQLSPIYGKLRFYTFIMDYDVFIGAGPGLVRTLETCDSAEAGCSAPWETGRGLRPPTSGRDRTKIAGSLMGGMRVFFSNVMGLHLEVRDVVYADRASYEGQVSSDIRNNLFLFLGVSFLI